DRPGNVRQLRHALEHAFVVTGEEVTELAVSALPAEVRGIPEGGPDTSSPAPRNADAATQRVRVQQALRETGGNKTAAAEKLGVSRAGLYKMLRRLGIDT
ncbi:MAG: helix-turn-helix domain-containing protein, partial [Phycisphaerae bacterium]